MRIQKIEETYYLVSSKGKNIQTIVDAAIKNTGMRAGSFADCQLKRIFIDLFYSAIDLNKYYCLYYVNEYDSFREFLYHKERFEYEEIDELHLQENETIWRLRPEINSSYGYVSVLEGDYLEMLNQYLKEVAL